MTGHFKLFFKLTKLSLRHYHHQKHKVVLLPDLYSQKQVYYFSNNAKQQSKDQTLNENQQKIADFPKDCLKELQLNSIANDLGQITKHFMTKEQILELIEQKQRKNKKKNQQKKIQAQKKAAEEKKKKEKQEEQEKKRKEEEEASRNKLGKLWKLYKDDLVASIIIFGGIGGFVYYTWFQYWWSQRFLKKQIISRLQQIKTMYGKQKLEVLPYYTQNNETEQQLVRLIDTPRDGRVILIGGTAGMGKTTSIKEIANKRRHKGQQFFYISLRSQFPNDLNNNTQQQQKEFKEKLKRLKTLVGIAKNTAEQKKTTLVLDDINVFTILSEPRINEITIKLCDASANNKLKILAISSSSKFVNDLANNSFLSKACYVTVLQPKSAKDMEKSINNIFGDYFKDKQFLKYRTKLNKFQIQAKQHILEQGHSLRDIIQFISEVKIEILKHLENQKDQLGVSKIPSITSVIKKLENKKKEDLINKIQQTFQKYDKQLKYSSRFLKILANYKFSSKTIERNDCNQAQRQIKRIKYIPRDKVREITDQLDNNGIIVYCHPRSEFIRNVLKESAKQMNL